MSSKKKRLKELQNIHKSEEIAELGSALIQNNRNNQIVSVV